MKKVVSVCFVISLLIYLASSASATNESTLDQQLNHILQNEPMLNGGIAGISIRSAKSGEVIFQHNGNVRLRPASNQKLLTAAAALSTLGEDHSFKTELHTDGKIKGNTLKGNLYLKGKGSPALLPSDLDQLATKLKEAGIEVVRGHLIADDSWYDDVRYSIDLPWSDETSYYGSQISALTVSPDKDYDAGTVIIEVNAGDEVGDLAQVIMNPPTAYVSIKNEAVTVLPDQRQELTIKRTHGTNEIVVEGTIPIDAPKEKKWVSVWEPTGYVLDIFHQSLTKHNIEVKGKLKLGGTPDQTTLLEQHHSIPLSELLIPFMKLSNNGHAETLVKEMGMVMKGEGSWNSGLEVVKERLIHFGVNPDTIVLRDGSGISHVNLVPANEITLLLHAIQREEWFHTFFDSLPVAGESNRMVGGTLMNRMNTESTKGKVNAKTGTLSTVSSLSGYVITTSGEKLIFSILLNNVTDDSTIKKVEDKIVMMLANS